MKQRETNSFAFWGKIILLCSAAFWLALAVSTLRSGGVTPTGLLLLAEGVLYVVEYIGVMRRIRWLYWLVLLHGVGNVVLSLSGQFGVLYLVALILSALPVVCIVGLWISERKR